MDHSLPGSDHGIFLARIMEWAAISFSRGSSWLRDWNYVYCISCIADRFFTTEPVGKPVNLQNWIESMEVAPYKYGQLIFDKKA